jgi:hypothetical protein
MMNHWLQVQRRKKQKSWTAEFFRNNCVILKPRQVSITNIGSAALARSTFGDISILFKNAMSVSADSELIDLFDQSVKSMSNWHCCLRLYSGLKELEYFELKDLRYIGLLAASNIEDIKFTFSYNRLKHINK